MTVAPLPPLFWILLLGGTSCATSAPILKARNFDVQGHRGARAVRPENTLSAFRYALSLGVDTLELDLNVTRDGVPVITHDPAISPEICLHADGTRVSKPALIRSLTLKQAMQYDCGTLTHPRFSAQVSQGGERIPSFEEFLQWLNSDPNPRAKSVGLNVEIKGEDGHSYAKNVIELAKKYGVFSRMTLQSFEFRTLAVARTLEPTLVISALIEERPETTLAQVASTLKADIISPNQAWVTRHDVESLHAIGVRVIPWTANTPAEWTRLVRLGVDGIITDDPKALLEFRSGLQQH